ncbi:MAG: hypothetical protein EBS47_10795 [Betaproteobacteria bacterium]|jgi:hypothetical protein|nr:hypothetical protein [Betaproteobacteria bacterium]NBT11437.1 hypothetical protein [Betaproteobacteria bacterium]NBU50550.1 hypothetical protein [Betaproteobacteria bacterium]NBX95990.1 hypothetical protein [Betaproteobacteria bacterium]
MHVHDVITLENMHTSRKPQGDTGKGTVMGWRLPGERLTPAGWGMLFAVFLLPVLGVGLLLDALVQLVFGWCLGVWCWF